MLHRYSSKMPDTNGWFFDVKKFDQADSSVNLFTLLFSNVVFVILCLQWIVSPLTGEEGKKK